MLDRPDSTSTLSRVHPDDLDIIAKVAAMRAIFGMADDPTKKSLFAIVGFNAEITSAIALCLAKLPGDISVNINPDLNDGSLPVAWLTTQSATYFRNMPRSSGAGAIIFAVPPAHLSVVGATLGEVTQISEESLAQPDLWFEVCPNLQHRSPREKSYLTHFVQGARQAGLFASETVMLAKFMRTLDLHAADKPLERALNASLPAIRIPRGAGRFKKLGDRGRLISAASWKEALEEIQRRADDALHLRNERGAALDRANIAEHMKLLLNKGQIDETTYDFVNELIQDKTIEAGVWRPSQETVVRHVEWESIERILKSSKQAKKKELGQATLAYFESNLPRVLGDSDKAMLEGVDTEDRNADEVEKDFFFRNRDHLKEDKRLLKRWESFVFQKSEQHPDPLIGLALTVADMLGSAEQLPKDPRIVVVLEGADRKNYWKNKNTAISEYLRMRYRGLEDVLKPVGVLLDFGMCWSIDDEPEERTEKTSVMSRQFKFDVYLVGAEDLDAAKPFTSGLAKKAVQSAQLTWVMPPNSFANAYGANMQEIANGDRDMAVLLQGRFARAQRTDRASDGIIDLGDRASIHDARGGPNGILVDLNIPELNVGATVRTALEEMSGSIIRAEDAERIRRELDAFQAAYTKAVRAFTYGKGLAEPAVIEQSYLYGELLKTLREVARKDECRHRIWMPILSIGTAKSQDKPHVAISCPWHPFRLAEAVVKARHFADAFGEMIAHAGNGTSLRAFATLRTEAMHLGWHPTMSIVHDQPRARLLIESEFMADFGLMEPPTIDQGAEDAFDGYAREATTEFLEAAREYLELNPHERSNFSVVLYNADNRDLPSRFADQLARRIENESDLRCELILTHTDPKRLRQIYAEQNVTISRELDGVLASEAAQNFLSRLRVGFLDVADVGRDKGETGRAANIVFLHDVIARSAQTNWRKCEAPEGGWPSFAAHNPNAETRRQSHEHGSRKTEVLLVPAERPREVQAFVDLVHDLHTDDRDNGCDHFVPIREVKYDDGVVSKAIESAHNVAKWVVTFDGIADRQLLLSNDIKVIRFVTRTGSRHNVIVSTKENSRILMERLACQVEQIIGGSMSENRKLADLLVREAALISGRVVLRAARVENNALELLGLVLSRQLVKDSLVGGLVPIAWLLLDDFAAPLGHKGGKLADLLIVSLGEENGRKVVELLVLESKFINEAAFPTESKSSLEQTRASTNDLRDRIILDEDILNRKTWRTRLANLVIEHGIFNEDPARIPAKQWAKRIRTGDADLRIRGVSIVFVHDCVFHKPDPIVSEQDQDQRQYVFDKNEIAGVLRRMAGREGTPLTIAFPPATHADGERTPSSSEDLSIETDSESTQSAPSSVQLADGDTPGPIPVSSTDIPVNLAVRIGVERSTGAEVFWQPGKQSNGFFLVLGASGSGKTESLKVLGTSISQTGIPVLVFDFHGDVVLPDVKSILLSSGSSSTVGLNPMELDITSAEVSGLYDQRNALRQMIQRAVPALGHRQSSILREAFEEAYTRAGFLDGDASTWLRPAPTFADVQAILSEWTEDEDRKSQRGAIEGCIAAVETLFDHPIFKRDVHVSIDDMLASSVRLDLSKLPEEVRFVTTETLLQKLFRALRLRGPIPVTPKDDRERFRIFVIVDEAKILSLGGGERDRADKILNELITEARKFGLGMIVASQMSEHFSKDVRANAATWLVLKPMDMEEARKNAPNVQVEPVDLIRLVGRGDGYYRDRPASRARRVQVEALRR